MKRHSDIANSIGAAFATYSRIPVPPVRWEAEALRWQLCAFPLVGVILGALWCVLGALLTAAGVCPELAGALLTALPLLLTGGIHMDGFLDASDAIHSWRSPQERLRILEDPHVGAFALICGGLYGLLYYGLCTQLAVSAGEALAQQPQRLVPCCAPFAAMAVVFPMSRVFSALAVVYLPKARREGMARETAEASDGRSGRVLLGELALLSAGGLLLALRLGRPELGLLPAVAALVYARYRRMAKRLFGGVSGDLAGWFLQVCELVCLAAVTLDALVR